MERLRCGSGSGELPIDMQRTVGEINPRQHLQSSHQSSACTAVRKARTNDAAETVFLCHAMPDECEADGV